jgi:hypothetical protein
MTHNIIKTKNYLLVVDDSEIKYDDHFIDEYKMLYMLKTESTEKYKSVKKVISHLPLNEAPILEGVPLLPPLEDEVEPDPKLIDSMAMRYRHDFGLLDKQHKDSIRTTMIQLWEEVVGKGFYKAKEKYKWTDEDLRKALFDLADVFFNNCQHGITEQDCVEYQSIIIQSLQQSKMPVAFECEESVDSDSMYVDYVIYKPKTITNPQYQTVWVGKYIY